MGEWIDCRLADLCASIDYGFTAAADFDASGPKFLRITDIVGRSFSWCDVPRVDAKIENLQRYQLHHGDIVIARTGATTGESKLIQEPPEAVFASYLVRLKIREDVSPQFVAYWLKSPQFRAYLHGVLGDKSAQPNASATTLTRAPITLPRDRKHQDAIADILGALDEKVDLNRRANNTLEALARAIFRDWFVEFGPTRAKTRGEAPYLTASLWDMFPAELDEFDQPRGWQAVRMGDLFKLERGLSYKGAFLTSDGVPMINLGCFVAGGFFDETKLKPYSGEHRERHVVAAGTLLLANTDMTQNRAILGSPYVVDEESESRFLYSHHVYAARPLSSDAGKWTRFFYYHLLEPEFRKRADGFATGTTVLFLPRESAEDCKFVCPSVGIRDAFMKLVAPLLRLQAANNRECRTLSQTRDLLLPKLMSGEIEINDADSRERLGLKPGLVQA